MSGGPRETVRGGFESSTLKSGKFAPIRLAPRQVLHLIKREGNLVKTIKTLGLVMACIFAAPSIAQETKTTIGSFLVTTTKDPFSDGSNVIALAVGETDAMAIRCLDNDLSVVVMRPEQKWTEGDVFQIKFRADSKPVIEREGQALGDVIIQVADSSALIDDINGAKSVSFRVASATSTYTFTVPLRQSDKVAALVKKACGK
jgi:hypothetical protein